MSKPLNDYYGETITPVKRFEIYKLFGWSDQTGYRNLKSIRLKLEAANPNKKRGDLNTKQLAIIVAEFGGAPYHNFDGTKFIPVT